jgi:hypothetical protein
MAEGLSASEVGKEIGEHNHAAEALPDPACTIRQGRTCAALALGACAEGT